MQKGKKYKPCPGKVASCSPNKKNRQTDRQTDAGYERQQNKEGSEASPDPSLRYEMDGLVTVGELARIHKGACQACSVALLSFCWMAVWAHNRPAHLGSTTVES